MFKIRTANYCEMKSQNDSDDTKPDKTHYYNSNLKCVRPAVNKKSESPSTNLPVRARLIS